MKKLFLFKTENIFLALAGSAVIGVGISYSDFYLFHLFMLVFFLYQIHIFKKNNYKVQLNFLSSYHSLFLIFMLLWYMITLFWVNDYFLAFKYIFYIFCGVYLSLNIVQYSKTISKFDKVFSVLKYLFCFELIISLLESFSSFRMPISSYSNISYYFGKQPPDFTIDSLIRLNYLSPPTGFHWNTNDLAIAMSLVLPFFLCSKKIHIKLLGTISVSIILGMTASRAAFLGFILLFCVYLIFVKKNFFTLILIWIFTFMVFWTIPQAKDSQNPRLSELAGSVEALELFLRGDLDIGGSLEWRRELTENGLKALKNSYGIGLGAGGSTANQERIGPVAGRFTSMHNFWIEILVEGGVFFAIIMFSWYSSIIYHLFKISRTKSNPRLIFYSKALFLTMVSFVPSAVAASSTIYFLPMWIMFGLSISIINLYEKSDHVANQKIKLTVN